MAIYQDTYTDSLKIQAAKTKNYTTDVNDFGTYIPFTSGSPNLHYPNDEDKGNIIVFRNDTGVDMTVSSTASALVGLTTVGNTQSIVALCIDEGTYNLIGGVN